MNKNGLQIVNWIFRIVAGLMWAGLIISLVAQQLIIPWQPDAPATGAVLLLALPLVFIFYGVLFLLARVLGKSREIILWIILLVLGPFVLAIEYPEPDRMYSRSDLVVSPEVAGSYETLMRFAGDDGLAWPELILADDLLELAGTWTNVVEFKEQIEAQWNAFEHGRQYIQDLDAFPGLTDLDAGVPVSAEMPRPPVRAMLDIARVYSLHAMLQAQIGNTIEGLDRLSQLQSVILKGLPYSNTLITKLSFCAMSGKNTKTTYRIIKNTACSKEQLLGLKEGFPCLEVEHMTMRRVLISEFLFFQWASEQMLSQQEEHSPVFFGILYDHNHAMAEAQASINYYLSRSADNRYGLVLSSTSSVCLKPRFTPVWLYPKNFVGRLLSEIGYPSYPKAGRNILKTKIYSDLLALEIHRQLGEDLQIKDVYTGKEYLYDEQIMQFYSAGPDGIAQNEDDVFIK